MNSTARQLIIAAIQLDAQPAPVPERLAHAEETFGTLLRRQSTWLGYIDKKRNIDPLQPKNTISVYKSRPNHSDRLTPKCPPSRNKLSEGLSRPVWSAGTQELYRE